MTAGVKLSVLLTALFAFAISATPHATAQELLSNGDFELGLIDVFSGWEIEEFLTGSGDPVNAAAVIGFANHPMAVDGESGLWLRPFVGGVEATGYAGANAIVSQVVPVTPGETYSLVGHSNFEQNYSGGVDFVDGLSPLGALNGGVPVATPTQGFFELEFLDGSGVPIGSPVSLDLYNDDFQFSGGGWLEHSPVVGVAPAGAASVRVSAKALDMVANIDPGQSAFYDNFSLTAASAPASELLVNGDMNDFTQELPGWTFEELPEGTNTIELAGFANNTPDGATGLWIRGFVDGDGTAFQVVPGAEGQEFTFSAASLFEENYTGGLEGSGTDTMLELAFLDSGDAVIGEPVVLDLRDEQTNGGGWAQHTLNGTAPAGTANVRVSALITGLVTGTGGGLSAFLDDFSLQLASAGLAGDFNNDGTVDAADYTVWRDNLGDVDESDLNGNGDGSNGVDAGDYTLWASQYGQSSSSSSAVPEPSTIVMASLMSLAMARRSARRGARG